MNDTKTWSLHTIFLHTLYLDRCHLKNKFRSQTVQQTSSPMLLGVLFPVNTLPLKDAVGVSQVSALLLPGTVLGGKEQLHHRL